MAGDKETTPNKAPEGKIMDRKIEASGWSTFSAGLVQRRVPTSPPTSTPEQKQQQTPQPPREPYARSSSASSGTGSGVKAIVNWIEAGNATKKTEAKMPKKTEQGATFDSSSQSSPSAHEGEVSPSPAPLGRLFDSAVDSSPPDLYPSHQERRQQQHQRALASALASLNRYPALSVPPRQEPAPSQPAPSQPALPQRVASVAGPDVPEDHSLTLLQYKSFLNNRPLARCLDKGAAAATEPTTKVTKMTTPGKVPADGNGADKRAESLPAPGKPATAKMAEEKTEAKVKPAGTIITSETTHQQQTQLQPSPIKRTMSQEALAEAMQTLDTRFPPDEAASGSDAAPIVAGTGPVQRPEKEVKKFWRGVRSALRMDDDSESDHGDDDGDSEEQGGAPGGNRSSSEYSSTHASPTPRVPHPAPAAATATAATTTVPRPRPLPIPPTKGSSFGGPEASRSPPSAGMPYHEYVRREQQKLDARREGEKRRTLSAAVAQKQKEREKEKKAEPAPPARGKDTFGAALKGVARKLGGGGGGSAAVAAATVREDRRAFSYSSSSSSTEKLDARAQGGAEAQARQQGREEAMASYAVGGGGLGPNPQGLGESELLRLRRGALRRVSEHFPPLRAGAGAPEAAGTEERERARAQTMGVGAGAGAGAGVVAGGAAGGVGPSTPAQQQQQQHYHHHYHQEDRRRRLTAEEMMSEIDEFLGTTGGGGAGTSSFAEDEVDADAGVPALRLRRPERK